MRRRGCGPTTPNLRGASLDAVVGSGKLTDELAALAGQRTRARPPLDHKLDRAAIARCGLRAGAVLVLIESHRA